MLLGWSREQTTAALVQIFAQRTCIHLLKLIVTLAETKQTNNLIKNTIYKVVDVGGIKFPTHRHPPAIVHAPHSGIKPF